jgi:hypothetical protein
VALAWALTLVPVLLGIPNGWSHVSDRLSLPASFGASLIVGRYAQWFMAVHVVEDDEPLSVAVVLSELLFGADAKRARPRGLRKATARGGLGFSLNLDFDDQKFLIYCVLSLMLLRCLHIGSSVGLAGDNFTMLPHVIGRYPENSEATVDLAGAHINAITDSLLAHPKDGDYRPIRDIFSKEHPEGIAVQVSAAHSYAGNFSVLYSRRRSESGQPQQGQLR